MAEHQFTTVICGHCGHQLTVPVYCGNRFCPVCSAPRLSRVRRRLNWIIQRAELPQGYGIKFLTLTVSNQPDLANMLKFLTSVFRKLRQRAFWKQYVRGGAFVLEVTGRPGNWHAHIHAVIEARFIPYDLILSKWKSVSGSQGVYITRIPKRNVVGYLTKYLTKSSVPPEITDEVSFHISGFRLFQPFGCWYSISLEYRDSPPGCPKCGSHSFYPIDILYRKLDRCACEVRAP